MTGVLGVFPLGPLSAQTTTKKFKELWLIVKGMGTVARVSLLLLMILYACAIFFTNMIGKETGPRLLRWVNLNCLGPPGESAKPSRGACQAIRGNLYDQGASLPGQGGILCIG